MKDGADGNRRGMRGLAAHLPLAAQVPPRLAPVAVTVTAEPEGDSPGDDSARSRRVLRAVGSKP